MMKKIKFIFLLLLFGRMITAQISFEYIDEGWFDLAQGFTETANQEYVFVGTHEFTDIVFVRLDQEGALIEQKSVSILDSFVAAIGVYAKDSTFLVIGYGKDCQYCSQIELSIWVGVFSKDFELISVEFWPFASKLNNVLERFLLVENNMVLTGAYESVNGNKEFVVKYDMATREHYIRIFDDVYSLPPDILARSDSSGYVLYRANKLDYVDSLFDVINTLASPAIDTFSFVEGSILERQDSTFVIFSEVLTDDLRCFLFGQIDRAYNLMSWDTLFSAPKAGISGVWNLAAHNDALVESPDGNYYVGGTHHYAPAQVRPFLAKYDQDLNQVWSFKYGTPGQLYYMLGMKETSDNGCMLYGLRNLDGQSREAYILKVNADGVLTGETILPMNDIVVCYPNPTTDYIQFDLPNSTQKVNLELIDLSGRVLLAQKIAHQEQIDISFLPQGMYGYRVMGWSGELIGVGKLVVP